TGNSKAEITPASCNRELRSTDRSSSGRRRDSRVNHKPTGAHKNPSRRRAVPVCEGSSRPSTSRKTRDGTLSSKHLEVSCEHSESQHYVVSGFSRTLKSE